MARRSSNGNNSTANLGFEAKLWLAAEKPEGSIRGNELINDVRLQWREATWTTHGSPEGEWSELGSRDMDGKAKRPTERARRSQHNQAHQYPSPQRGNANFAHPLLPTSSFLLPTFDCMAGFVLVNGSMSSNQSGEGTIRQALIEADLVDCMVALPGQLFSSTQIPACLWFLAKNKTGGRD